MATRAEKEAAEWWQTAYHESGHAITRANYSLPLLQVTIGPRGSGLTEAGGLVELDCLNDERIIAEAVTSFAGPLAEAWYLHATTGMPYKAAHRRAFNSSTGDLNNITELAEHMQWRARQLRSLEDEASNLVAELWESIGAAADALYGNGGHLTGDQVYRIA